MSFGTTSDALKDFKKLVSLILETGLEATEDLRQQCVKYQIPSNSLEPFVRKEGLTEIR